MNGNKLRVYGGSDYAVTDDDVVVTPEMIEAGGNTLVEYEASDDHTSNRCIAAVYRAMERVRREAKKRAGSKT